MQQRFHWVILLSLMQPFLQNEAFALYIQYRKAVYRGEQIDLQLLLDLQPEEFTIRGNGLSALDFLGPIDDCAQIM